MSERYKQFYEDYKNKLFSYLVTRSGDYDVAQDIMQESFVRHFQHYGNEAVISPGLLFTIARNTLTDHFRYRNRFQITEDIIPRTEADEESLLETKETTAGINAALARLSEVDREIITLAVAGTPYKDIAFTLQITEANVKVRVHRARVKLREIMKEEVK